MSETGRFPRSARIRRKKEFEQVYRTGIRLTAFPLRARALRRESGESRLGLSIGGKVGKAVLRNRWKRAIREAFRRHRQELVEPYDLVVSCSWQACQDDVERVEEAFVQIVRTLNSLAAVGEQEP